MDWKRILLSRRTAQMTALTASFLLFAKKLLVIALSHTCDNA